LLVILETVAPAELLAFVLHDMFSVPFDEIAGIVGRSPTAARQLASRARRRVQGTPAVPEVDFSWQREVVEAYLAAARGGDLEGLLAVLDPDVVLRADRSAVAMGALSEIRGARAVAEQAAKRRAQFARAALVNGVVGIVVAPRGRLLLVLSLTVEHGKISEIEIIGDPRGSTNLTWRCSVHANTVIGESQIGAEGGLLHMARQAVPAGRNVCA
jgi:RNA polymerase sigma-70 factor (ECF subfamily)